jgi:hypothetical protein
VGEHGQSPHSPRTARVRRFAQVLNGRFIPV